MNFLMINDRVVGVGYLPDDDDAVVYDLQGKIVVPNMWAFSPRMPSESQQSDLQKNGFHAVATLEKGDLQQRDNGLVTLPHPRLKVFDWGSTPEQIAIPDWAGIIIGVEKSAQLDLISAQLHTGRHYFVGIADTHLNEPWVIEGIKRSYINFIYVTHYKQNTMGVALNTLFHNEAMDLDIIVRLFTKGIHSAYGAKPKGIAVHTTPSFSIYSPQSNGRCDCLVVNGNIVFNHLTPTTDMDTTFKQS